MITIVIDFSFNHMFSVFLINVWTSRSNIKLLLRVLMFIETDLTGKIKVVMVPIGALFKFNCGFSISNLRTLFFLVNERTGHDRGRHIIDDTECDIFQKKINVIAQFFEGFSLKSTVVGKFISSEYSFSIKRIIRLPAGRSDETKEKFRYEATTKRTKVNGAMDLKIRIHEASNQVPVRELKAYVQHLANIFENF
ncbi:hypothetical protein K501DRAFT_275247 [Backusella circina FSU 941]|nr:hypothetical protein K501DRAFT_275247 [Backusella circina FSU 941]